MKSIRMKPSDREIFAVGRDDLTVWTQWYFDGWTPLPYQHTFYHAPQRQKTLISGIRTGKTTGIAASFMHYLYYHPGCRIANASISADQANIVFLACSDFANRPRFQHWVEKIEKHPYPRIRLTNGAEAWFRSVGYEAELWRGWEFDWINIDEAAYITRESAVMTLQGRLLGVRRNPLTGESSPREGIMTMTSSPKGKTWLFERWKRGDPNFSGSDPSRYLSMRARIWDNIHLRAEDIEAIMAEMTDRQIQQELEGLFLDSDNVVFPYEDVMDGCNGERAEVESLVARMEAFLDEKKLRNRTEIDYYQLEPKNGHIYLNSWDLGKRPTKKGRNAMVGGVFDITTKPWELVAYRYAPGASFGVAHEWIKEWDLLYKNYGNSSCETVIDATGKGDVLNEQLQEERINVDGIVYSGATKPQLVHSLQIALEKRWIVYPFIRRMVDQLQSYELPDDKIAQDIVMMLAQGAFRARQIIGDIQKEKNVRLDLVGRPTSRITPPELERFIERRRAIRSGRRTR